MHVGAAEDGTRRCRGITGGEGGEAENGPKVLGVSSFPVTWGSHTPPAWWL